MQDFLIALFATFIFLIIAVGVFLGVLRALGIYAVVQEGTSRVYVLFGNVIGVITDPGLHDPVEARGR